MPQKKILIVDTDVASRNFIARKLYDANYDVLQAGSGKEGLIGSWRDRPDLVIFDPVMADLKGEDFAAKLRNDPRTTHIPLIALSSDPSLARAHSCLDAGFNEYITKSGQAVSMLMDMLVRLLGLTEEAMKQGGLSIIFTSAKGGTGTSSMCANIAMNIAQNQPEARLVVLDLVLPIGSIAPIVGYDGALNIVSVADMPADATTPQFFHSSLPNMGIWRFNLLAGSPDPELSNHLNVGRIWDIVTALKASHDYVLIDIGRSLSKITLPLIQHADLAALLISTDISTISLTKTLLDYLIGKGVNPNSIFTILNRAVGLEGLSKADAEKILGIRINAAMPYLGTNFAFANSHHQPFTLKFPNDTASLIFTETAREMSAQARRLRGE
ncbi:MAG TPA: response regulator [Anaerolineales bacterium]|mgnify:FL=1|jgi:pilus assembly protein CpaE|nr:response regulator [Anaerolineales bacterium]